MPEFDTTRLVQQVTIKGALPDGYFTDQEILNMAYDSLLGDIVPLIIDRKEEYYVREKEYTITAQQKRYTIPDRAMGGQLRLVQWIDGNQIRYLERIDPRWADRADTGDFYKFYLQNNDVVLWPTPNSTGKTLKLTYFFRPSKLVPVSECAQITVINGNTITVSAIPTGWTTAETFDFTKGTGSYENIDFGYSINAISTVSNTLTFVATPPAALQVGDWISLADESCFPYMPKEAQISLIHSTVSSCLESMGDPAFAVAQQRTEQQKAILERMLSIRIEGQMKSFRTRVRT